MYKTLCHGTETTVAICSWCLFIGPCTTWHTAYAEPSFTTMPFFGYGARNGSLHRSRENTAQHTTSGLSSCTSCVLDSSVNLYLPRYVVTPPWLPPAWARLRRPVRAA